MCLLRLVSIILAEISAHHLQLKCMGGYFFSCHPYIESTTILSDIYLCFKVVFKILSDGMMFMCNETVLFTTGWKKSFTCSCRERSH